MNAWILTFKCFESCFFSFLDSKASSFSDISWMNGLWKEGRVSRNECGTATGKNVFEGKNDFEGKECDGSTKQKEPEKKNEKMGQERESWQLVEDGFACLYSSSVNPLIRAVGPGSRHSTGQQEEEESPREMPERCQWSALYDGSRRPTAPALHHK